MAEMTAEEILVARRRMGLTQEQLARRLRVTVTSVSRWERGQKPSMLARAVLREFFESEGRSEYFSAA
jgi:DNA-binding transcriptional regulator YiaG